MAFCGPSQVQPCCIESSPKVKERSRAIALREAQNSVPGARGERSVTQFRHGTLEVKLSSPEAPNEQTPHEKDELYFVARGSGYLWHDGKRDSCRPGDVLFVAAGTEHHFEEFSDDFQVWVVYYGQQGGELGAQQAVPGATSPEPRR